MNRNQYAHLLNKVKTTIQKRDTNMRRVLSAESKLNATLRFLASGNSYAGMQYLFRIPKNSISKFVPEVLDAIYDALSDYLKVGTI